MERWRIFLEIPFFRVVDNLNQPSQEDELS